MARVRAVPAPVRVPAGVPTAPFIFVLLLLSAVSDAL